MPVHGEFPYLGEFPYTASHDGSVAARRGWRPRESLMVAVLRWARARRFAVLTAAVVAGLLSLIAVRGLTFDADVLHLLPKHGRAVPAFEQFLQRFGSLDHLYVVFEAPAGHTIDEYEERVAAFVERLARLPEIERVDAGLFGEGRDWAYVADRALLVLSADRADTALARFAPDRLPSQLAAARDLLSLPSPEVAAMVRQDPLGLFTLLRDQLQGAAASLTIDPSRGGYVTKDGRSQLVLARPRRPPFDTDFSKQLFAQLAELEREAQSGAPGDGAPRDGTPRDGAADDEALPPLTITFAGGHRISLETEREVRSETVWNSVGSLVVILPLLFLAFRSPWLVAVGPLPSALAIAMMLGLYAVAGVTLSAAATGAAAMLFGLGIDGVVLMFVAFRQQIGEGRSPDEAIAGLGGSASSMLLGMWTTAATFYGLTVIDFPSLQELGALIGHGMVLCGLLTLVLVPALFPRRVTRRVPPLTAWWLARFVTAHATKILIVAIVLTGAMIAAAKGLTVDAGLDKLRSTSAAADVEQQIAARFGLPRDVLIVLARGTDLDALLADNERFVDALARARPSLLFYAPSSLLPSEERQAAAGARIERAGLTAEDVAARLQTAARDAGFAEETFAPFLQRLPRLLDSRARLTYDGFAVQGLEEVLSRTIARDGADAADGGDRGDGGRRGGAAGSGGPRGSGGPGDAAANSGNSGSYTIATYLYPADDADMAAIRAQLADFGDRMTLTGLPEVNRELASRFTPEFLKGLALGTALVLLLLIASFRRLDLTMLALVPTVLALIWAGGLLALARVELDLFSVFAVMTFVGIGVDYGIHMVHRVQHLQQPEHAHDRSARAGAAESRSADTRDAHRHDVGSRNADTVTTDTATTAAIAQLAPVIMVAGGITLLGFGTLVTSSYGPLRSLGVISIVMVITLMLSSLLVLPALLVRRGRS